MFNAARTICWSGVYVTLGAFSGGLLGSLLGFCWFAGCHVERVTTPILPRLSPSPEASAMIGLVRLHTYKAGEFHLFDAP